MNILIVGSSQGASTADEREYYEKYVTFFTESAATVGGETQVYTALFDDLLIDVGDGNFSIVDVKNGQALDAYDVFFLRGNKFRAYMDIIGTISTYAKQHSIPVVNEIETGRVASKLLQAVNFEQLGLPVARTLCVNAALIEHFDKVERWIFPCIMKARFGSHGNNNHVVSSLDEVRSIVQKDLKIGYVLQRNITNDGDYRILLIGNEELIIKRSAAAGSHLNNTSQGALASLVDPKLLPGGLLKEAHTIADYYHLAIAGVDAIQSIETGAYYFLEVNAQPQLMTGAFLDAKKQMVGVLLQQLRNTR